MNDIIIDKAILHILDTSIEAPVLADRLMSFSPQADEFLKMHILRAMEDGDIKKGGFKGRRSHNEEPLPISEPESTEAGLAETETGSTAGEFDTEGLKSAISNLEPANFITVSQQLAQKIFDLAVANPDIPAADLLMCHFQYDNGIYFGVLKFNYKQSYIHHFAMIDNEKETGIIQQNATIANENQKLDEFAFIRLDDFSVLIKEKKYEINGAKEFYLSNRILHVTTDLSPKTKVKIVEKAAEKVIKEYYGEDPLKVSQLKTELKTCVDESSIVEIDRITNAVFDGNFSAQQRYKEEVAQKGISGRAFEVTSEIEKTVARKQKITTDTGIEISLPVNYLENQKNIEFIMNEDGTMSILIKSVNIR
ncbi:nucleoid-associated protein [Aminipila luticellarii]|uniref:Nucleoid-associated protein n=1 Tax=Aminipila luticellarii TaxID=2507160 RepID=A0A410PSR5_9FIRM|nr:nucleoid-associated protein [Aminipila luticellarii]QAT41926.1 nucleoid-associated protein [Aminipila luticellarii]